MILALDPSSSRTGYALVTDDGKLIDAGSLTAKERDPANVRIRTMIDELGRVFDEHNPTLIVVEDTSGKVAGRLGRAQGLAVHGKAVGWFIAECIRLIGSPNRVELVCENTWTGGVPKERRADRTRARFPLLSKATDLDALDAVGLAVWWVEIGRHRQPVVKVTKRRGRTIEAANTKGE